MKPIRLAHVTTVDMSLRYLLLNQLVSLRQAGYDVMGISSFGPDVATVQAAGIPHFTVSMTRRFSPLADLGSLWTLYRVFRQQRLQIVHTHTPKPGLLGQVAARLAGVPIVLNTLHGFYFHDHMPTYWRWFYITLEKIAALCSDVILSQNLEDIQTAMREGICASHKIKYLGNGIDLKRFDPQQVTPAEAARVRAELGFSPEERVVGFVGRLVKEKGVNELLAAAPQVRAAIPNVRFLFVGPIDVDKPDAVTSDTAQRYGVAEFCCFTGLRTDLPELLAVMDILALPSYREGFPRVPMEAAAMGVPCVVTDIRGCREVVEASHNGLLVPVRDAASLAQALITLLRNDEQRLAMGRAGRQRALERFDEQLVFEKVKQEYVRLLAAKGFGD